MASYQNIDTRTTFFFEIEIVGAELDARRMQSSHLHIIEMIHLHFHVTVCWLPGFWRHVLFWPTTIDWFETLSCLFAFVALQPVTWPPANGIQLRAPSSAFTWFVFNLIILWCLCQSAGIMIDLNVVLIIFWGENGYHRLNGARPLRNQLDHHDSHWQPSLIKEQLRDELNPLPDGNLKWFQGW